MHLASHTVARLKVHQVVGGGAVGAIETIESRPEQETVFACQVTSAGVNMQHQARPGRIQIQITYSASIDVRFKARVHEHECLKAY